jgi:hypothetical protein
LLLKIEIIEHFCFCIKVGGPSTNFFDDILLFRYKQFDCNGT